MIACFSSCKMTTDVRLSVTINSFLYEHYVTQHEINNQWRQREFNVGGDEAPKGMGPSPPPPPLGRRVWEGKIFVISKWHILVILRC